MAGRNGKRTREVFPGCPEVHDGCMWPNLGAAGETRLYESSVLNILLDNLGRLWRGGVQLRNQVV